MDTFSSKELDEISKALEESSEETMAIVGERDFKELYLPVFSGEKINDRAINAWIYLAGGPTRQVRVVNEATGESLFIVPAWFSTDHMSIQAPTDTSLPSFNEVVAQAMMCASHSPIKASQDFQAATLRHIAASINKETKDTLRTQWGAIFERYGISEQDILNNFKRRIEANTGVTQEGSIAGEPEPGTTSLFDDGCVVEE